MDTEQARLALEALRKGIPPEGMIRHFTVGKSAGLLKLIKVKNIFSEGLRRLSKDDEDDKDDKEDGVIFIKPSDGSGKTHYLKLVEEEALARGFAVSFVSLDNKSGIRLDRMDHILGAVLRNLRIPQEPSTKGIRPFFELIGTYTKEWSRSSWNGDAGEEPDPFFCALRAWLTGRPETQALVEDWLYSPWQYTKQKRKLYSELISKLNRHFIDKRPKEEFLSGEALAFEGQERALSWDALRNINLWVQMLNLKGFLMLFDNLNDIESLRGVEAYMKALRNIRRLSWDSRFYGLSFLSLYPEIRLRRVIFREDNWEQCHGIISDHNWIRNKAKSLEISPLNNVSLIALFKKIVVAHGIAYGWNPSDTIDESTLGKMAAAACTVKTAGRTRNAVVQCVTYLDSVLQQR